MSGKTTLDSPLANIASGIEERRCDLIGRHRHLRDKVATLERSIPALMAYNMWMADGRDCRDAPYRKVRELVNELSPQPDPVDRLLAELRDSVDDLHREMAQLHDKIIDADVKLEETAMELESLELANEEMEEKLAGLRDEVKRHSTPSLHSIHSEDLICLRKIRQLAEEEFKLKNCIEELKTKETMYRRQMRQLLSCKRFQRDFEGRVTERAQEPPAGRVKRSYCSQKGANKRNALAPEKKYTLGDKGQKICCSCPTSIPSAAREQTSKRPFHPCRSRSREKLYPPLSCCVPLDGRETTDHKPRGRCRAACKPCQPTSIAISKSKFPRSTSSPCEFPLDASKTGISRSLKHLSRSSLPCDPGKTCNECEILAECKQIGSCRCTCEGKCTRVLSTEPCDCSVTPKVQSSEPEADDSDEEFCECCSCGCEGSENSS